MKKILKKSKSPSLPPKLRPEKTLSPKKQIPPSVDLTLPPFLRARAETPLFKPPLEPLKKIIFSTRPPPEALLDTVRRKNISNGRPMGKNGKMHITSRIINHYMYTYFYHFDFREYVKTCS